MTHFCLIINDRLQVGKTELLQMYYVGHTFVKVHRELICGSEEETLICDRADVNLRQQIKPRISMTAI
ncbi:hypothetical protein GCM10028807_35340 [Spirosoma daeguense]